MNHKQITEALKTLAPEAEWSLIGDNYDDLIWHSAGSKPAKLAIEAEIANPTPKPEPTLNDKLASVGLSLEELKAAING